MGWIKPKGKRKKVQVKTYQAYWMLDSGALFTTTDYADVVGAKRLTKYSYYQLMRVKQLQSACLSIEGNVFIDELEKIKLIARQLFMADRITKDPLEILVSMSRTSTKNPHLYNIINKRSTVKEFFELCISLQTKLFKSGYGKYGNNEQ